jgi:drug/metabolite transporter (DMT)-like permease
MTGALWAVIAGAGFGVFQTLNRRAVEGMDVYLSTFLQLGISALVLLGISILSQDMTRLWQAPPAAWLNFCLAGLVHFFIGWTFLNASQKRIGAARTGALIGTAPLFAAAISVVTLGEVPSLVGMAGIVLTVAGVLVTSNLLAYRKTAAPSEGLIATALALAAPLCWSISPTFTRLGLAGLDSPLLGVTLGLTASSICYGVLLVVRGLPELSAITTDALVFKVIAGVLVGLATWLRWIALDMAPVAVVLAISLISVPTVNLLTPMVVKKHLERVTGPVWGGSALIIAGSLVLILT